MTRYRVSFFHDVEATTKGEAEAIARERGPGSVRVIALEAPADRHDSSAFYVQTIETLDTAWDEFMERTALQVVHPQEVALSTPTLLRLSQARIGPPQLSLLFDLAITGYRQRAERGDAR